MTERKVSSIDELNERWVHPHYMNLLGANFMHRSQKNPPQLLSSLKRDLSLIEEETVGRLLRLTWREQLTGAWFAGLNGWTQFTDLIGGELIQSRYCYAGEGYCFALARFANEKSNEYLRLYLDEYLPQVDRYYDQRWALGALLWLDSIHGTNYAQTYVEPDGLWERFIAGKSGSWQTSDAEKVASDFSKIMHFCEDHIDA